MYVVRFQILTKVSTLTVSYPICTLHLLHFMTDYALASLFFTGSMVLIQSSRAGQKHYIFDVIQPHFDEKYHPKIKQNRLLHSALISTNLVLA